MMAENKREILFDAYVKRTWWWPKRRLFYYRDPDTGEIDEYNKEDFREFLVGEGFFKKFVDSRAGDNGNGSESAKEKKQKKAECDSCLKFCRS